MAEPNVLIVDDEPSIRHMLSTSLRLAGYRPAAAASATEALGMLAGRRFRAVLCDVRLPDRSGLELLEEIRQIDGDALIIMISAYGTIDLALEAVRRGAQDFLSKPFNPDEIVLRLRRAEEQQQLREDHRRLQQEVQERYAFHNIVGKSAALQALFEKVRKVAPTKSTVLITGESGTGKELFARALHYVSPRRERPFVAVNCGAIPENLLESELFGHVRGAFTGATGHKRGLFEEASGSTLFLDEIGELPPTLQVKLLRVLEEEEIRKVGDTRTISVDVRVIAATARNLEEEVRAGRFREELFYRLNVISLGLPPLRERPEDIPLLAEHHLRQLAGEHARPAKTLAPAALQALVRHRWPGNVRELLNALEEAFLLTDGPVIGPADLPPRLAGAAVPTVEEIPGTLSLRENRRALERRLVSRALTQSGGSRSKAALLLGISLRGLLYKIKEFGLDREG